MGRCIGYIKIRLLHILPFISSFFFLSNFQTLKFFVTLFLGTMRPRRLKLHTLVDSGQMYRVYWNQAAAPIRPFIFYFFFLSNFQTLIFFVTLFSGTVRPRRLKLVKHVKSGWMYVSYVLKSCSCSYSSLYFFICLSLQFSNIKKFRHTFLRNYEARRLKLVTHVDSGKMYRVYRNQAAAAYLSLYFFIFLSNILILKVFVTFFSGTVRPRR